ncbi:unnamed protein product, partial [Thlaspi arvense]
MSSLCSVAVLLSSLVLFLATESLSHPLCNDLTAPFNPKQPLAFCQFNGSVCCNSKEDLELQRQFQAVNVSESCSPLLKSLLCSTCDPFAAELFRAESESRQVPVLCNSTVSSNKSTQSLAETDFCGRFWNECQYLSVNNTPFASQAGDGGNTSTISKIWKSRNDFCDVFGGSSDESSVCFNGQAVSFNISKATVPPPSGICLEKLANGSYLNMAPHPDGTNRVFLSDQAGKTYLATIPAEGSGEILKIDETNLFLDLTEEVHSDAELGLLGIAFHPDFSKNGRFFVSFNCDRVKWPECSGKCACNSDVDCDPAKLDSDNGANPCQYHSVISEFFSNGTYVKPVEVRRIFTVGLPFTSHHGGQILFGPKDGYLYFMMGDGGSKGDPHNFAQNKKSLLGKIMRLDDKYEEVDMITKGGNYGWHYYEGPLLFNPSKNTNSTKISNPISPVMWYNHSEGSSASITGGYFYRSSTDPCLYGMYLFADLYAGVIYGGAETPVGSGNFTSSHIPLRCSSDSPIPCSFEIEPSSSSSSPPLGFVFSFGEDNKKDIYLLASSGVYRIVRPSRCNFHCPLEKKTSLAPSQQPDRSPTSPSLSKQLHNISTTLVIEEMNMFNSKCLTLLRTIHIRSVVTHVQNKGGAFRLVNSSYLL